tara:strand:- start:760 stop:1245 length:486 start_codon:yes stop_codon:yes gene_type:complete
MLKKIFILLCFSVLITIIACGDDSLIIEPKVSIDSVDFPFENRKNGKFMSIYRNNGELGIPITFVMAKQREVLSDSQDYNFCPDIQYYRKGVVNPEWFVVNHNILIIPEKEVLNQNDHPNLISYSLPIGTYLLFLMDGIDCNENQYEVFDITTSDALRNNL